MDDISRQRPETVTSLREAVRKARLADAERGAAIADLRAGELVRLEILRDALNPVFSELPDDGELFDHGIVPGERPRLFIDILAYVEMGRDKRQYRFVQDSRWGQRVIAETDDIQAVIRAVTDYVALRLVERSKALASDATPPPRLAPAPAPVVAAPQPAEPPVPPRQHLVAPAAVTAPPPPPYRRARAAVPPWLVFLLGIVAGIMVTLFVGLLRARGLIAL